MALPGALHLALDLARSPLLAPAMRKQPVPKDVLLLLRLAAADADSIASVSHHTGRDGTHLRAAAVLYIQQVLWGPGGDHYRTLGVAQSAPPEKLKEHMRLLMKWLHPDRPQTAQESAFRERVLAAWNAVKTPERRQQYDRTLLLRPSEPRQRRRRSTRLPWISAGPSAPSANGHIWWRVAGGLVAVIAAVSWWTSQDWSLPWTGKAAKPVQGALDPINATSGQPDTGRGTDVVDSNLAARAR